MNRTRWSLCVLMLIAGFCVGMMVSARLNIFSEVAARPAPEEIDLSTVSFADIFVKVAERVTPSVVMITTEKVVELRPFDPFREFFGDQFEELMPRFRRPQPRQHRQQGLGSGFIIRKDGYILTNNHVIQGVDEIKVRLHQDRNEYTAKVVGTDPKTDLALLKIEARAPLPAVELGDSDRLRPGDWVLAIGNPFGLESSVCQGVVSAKGRSFRRSITEYEDFIQTTATINRGNSGGPLVDLKGRVVGVNTFIVNPAIAQGLSFAIPVNMTTHVIKDLLEHGEVIRGFLGVSLQELTAAQAILFGVEDGALVAEVVSGSPAEAAGLKSGDVIISYDGQKITSPGDLQKKVVDTQVGSTVTLKAVRDGKEMSFTVKIGRLEDDPAARPVTEEARRKAGLVVEDITAETAREMGLSDQEGALVAQVEPASPAEAAGLTRGDVIKSVDRKPIATAAEFHAALNEASPGDTLVFKILRAGRRHYLDMEIKE